VTGLTAAAAASSTRSLSLSLSPSHGTRTGIGIIDGALVASGTPTAPSPAPPAHPLFTVAAARQVAASLPPAPPLLLPALLDLLAVLAEQSGDFFSFKFHDDLWPLLNRAMACLAVAEGASSCAAPPRHALPLTETATSRPPRSVQAPGAAVRRPACRGARRRQW